MTDTEAGAVEAGAATAAVDSSSLLEEILSETEFKPDNEHFEVAKAGIEAFVKKLLSDKPTDRIDPAVVDAMIAEVDERLSDQLNEILHHEEFQGLEAAWRSLQFAVERIDFRQNIRVSVLSATKDELLEDFEDQNMDIPLSRLYRLVYTDEYGQFGGRPYGVLCANHEFDAGGQDLKLLQSMAAVSAMSHAPLISNVGADFFGKASYEEVAKIKDIPTLFEGPKFASWRGFRDSEDARYVGLCGPRMLLRLPYGKDTIPVKTFNFTENCTGHHDRYLWGPTSVALVTRIADSFAKYRWAPNIIGPKSGGTVDGLPLHHYEALGETQTKVPTEILISEKMEYDLSGQGLISLCYRKESDNAAFFSANSAQRPKTFGDTEEGIRAETNFRLGTQLPYMLIMTRLAHYVKVLQRENIGSWKERRELERELNNWLSQYVSDQEDPAPGVRSSRPLRKADVKVSEVPGEPGWYRSVIRVQPHIKFMGANFELSLVGKLDKE